MRTFYSIVFWGLLSFGGNGAASEISDIAREALPRLIPTVYKGLVLYRMPPCRKVLSVADRYPQSPHILSRPMRDGDVVDAYSFTTSDASNPGPVIRIEEQACSKHSPGRGND